MLNEWNIMWYIYYYMNYLYLIILFSLLNINKFLKIACLDLIFKVYFELGISYKIFLMSLGFFWFFGVYFLFASTKSE